MVKTKDEVVALRAQVAELTRKVEELATRLNLTPVWPREIHHHHYPAPDPVPWCPPWQITWIGTPPICTVGPSDTTYTVNNSLPFNNGASNHIHG